MDNKETVKKQFGENAAAYATSKVHAKGASLQRLVTLVQPKRTWTILDVATAAGHTAFTFAPHVSHVTATDLTPEMLNVAAGLAQEKGIYNVTFKIADAEQLPFGDEEFDLVTCRIAPHHFGEIGRFIAEAYRVLRPDGILAVVDNVVPGSHLRGKKANAQRAAGDYINAFEKLRDPSHAQCWSLNQWVNGFCQVGFAVVEQETAQKQMRLTPWADRMQVSPDNKQRLRAMLIQAPEIAANFFNVQREGEELLFHLTEAIIVAKKD